MNKNDENSNKFNKGIQLKYSRASKVFSKQKLSLKEDSDLKESMNKVGFDSIEPKPKESPKRRRPMTSRIMSGS